MIFGRKKEQETLNKLLASKNAEFLAVYGRRRIGKTYLIHEFFQDQGLFLEVTGSNEAPKREQIYNFHLKLKAFSSDVVDNVPKTWSEAFHEVVKLVQNLDPQKKFIFFIDELPWFASPRSGFLSALDYFWNAYLSRFRNALLIICGSSAHWMIEKVINDRGGLHGRLSAQLRMEPFSLGETEQFLQDQGVQLQRKQLIELYMALGGVAKYLTAVSSGKSAVQIINELCFSPSGMLLGEFTKLYKSLFDSAEHHMAIVRTLAKKRRGLSQSELLQMAKIPYGGTATTVLQELEESGFIMSIQAFGKRQREKHFRLIDEYSLFYLTWIEEVSNQVLRKVDQDYWTRMSETAAWKTWAGYAFENVCLKHSWKIKIALGFAGVLTSESHWQHRGENGEEGAEIDLVIDRADDCINLCEIKFCAEEFEMTEAYAEELERKIRVFRKVTGTRKTIFMTMITPFGVKKNMYYLGVVHHQLTMDALF